MSSDSPPRPGTGDPPGSLRLRLAAPRDIPLLAELFNLAFPGERTVEDRARGLRAGGVFGGLETTYLAEGSEGVAGAFRAYRFAMHLHGRVWPTLGLAAVAVSPSFRRRGVGRWMCREAFRVGRERGDVLSALYPFRVSFYGSLGYSLAGTFHRYRFKLDDLARSPGWERVTWLSRGETAPVREVYARVAARSNGLLERTERMWGFLAKERFSTHLYRDAAGAPRGYVVVSFRPGANGLVLVVRELLAETGEAYEGLLGWIAAQRDQGVEGVLDTLPGEEFHRRLGHPRRPRSGPARELWFESARVLQGPMVRILDVPGLLAASGLPPSAAGEVDDEDPVAVADLTRRFLAGALPGQEPAQGWSPVRGIHDHQLLDQF